MTGARTRPPPDPSNVMATVVLGLLGLAAVGASAAWAAWWLAARFSDAPAAPGSPLQFAKAVTDGTLTWPAQASAWAAGVAGVAVAAAVVVGMLVGRRRGGRRPLDRAAREMPTDNGLRRYTRGATGPPIGRVVSRSAGRHAVVRMTAEDQGLVVAGPRTGKTTALAIPAAVAHVGPMLATSNKRDLYDHIRGPRGKQGKVWLFDPQSLASTTGPGWWWDPLEMAANVPGARQLARLWSSAGRAPGARVDAYFDPEGDELLASLLLAAAVGRRPIVDVYTWLTRPDDPTPARCLDEGTGCEQMAEGLRGRSTLPERQRAGVYGTAAKAVSWMADPAIRAWIEPGRDLEQFRADQLSHGTDTLVSLSKEGEGSASALVASLTAAVLTAAERHAARSPQGRLQPTLLGVLDEACNVCRWKELPDLYSHYGSRGIVLVSYAQSWAQLTEAYGREGAEKLWSSANVRVYGGGVSDPEWLRRISDLVGEWEEQVWSTSTSTSSAAGSGAQRSRSMQSRRRAIFDVASLASLPAGRAVVMLSAARPVLVELQPWWNGPHADGVRASLAPEPAQ